MHKKNITAIVFIGLCAVVTIPATTQAPTPTPSVWLQPSSPGTAQTGNISINGKYVGAVSTNDSRAISVTASGDDVKGVYVNSSGFHSVGIDISATGSGLRSNSSGGIGVSGVGASYGVYGSTTQPSGIGVFGFSDGSLNSIAIQGLNPGSGIGVYGVSNLYGVKGEGQIGVYGHSVTGNAGVSGQANSTFGSGVVGQASGSSGYGVVGNNIGGGIGIIAFGSTGVKSNGTSGDGVYGETSSNVAAGISGVNTAGGLGVYASSVSGYGVQATCGGFAGVFGTGTTNGLYGLTGNSGASAVYAVNSNTGWGVYGTAVASGTAVAGVNPDPTGYGVYCHGRLTSTGTKLFQIDHPFDPENKYLNHFCTEGAEPLNVYSGTVCTDDKGYATVALPDYFAEINKDARIQLTVVDDTDDFVIAKVTRKVIGCEFELRTSKPNTEVFWRVEAVRNDNWVRTHGFSAEEEKPTARKGTYVNPEFYGKPKELGQSYVPAAPATKKRQSGN